MNNLKEAAQKKYGCRWSELHETTREDFEAGWFAAKSDDKAQPVGWMRPDELRKAKLAPYLCRVHPEKDKHADMIPVYTSPQPPAEQGAELSDERGSEDAMICSVDAAMVEMRNIHPPLRRSECQRLIHAALAAYHAARGDV